MLIFIVAEILMLWTHLLTIEINIYKNSGISSKPLLTQLVHALLVVAHDSLQSMLKLFNKGRCTCFLVVACAEVDVLLLLDLAFQVLLQPILGMLVFTLRQFWLGLVDGPFCLFVALCPAIEGRILQPQPQKTLKVTQSFLTASTPHFTLLVNLQ